MLLQYTFTATPVGGGPALTITAASPSATMTGLSPGKQVCSVPRAAGSVGAAKAILP